MCFLAVTSTVQLYLITHQDEAMRGGGQCGVGRESIFSFIENVQMVGSGRPDQVGRRCQTPVVEVGVPHEELV